MIPTRYESQNGRVTPIAEMHADHLDRAIAKLAKTRKDPAMLEALKAESARRVANG